MRHDAPGRRVLYLSYDGMSDPLGQSQVLPYLRGLAARGHAIELLSFEKRGAPLWRRREIAPGLVSTRVRYHQHPTVPATTFDIARGAAVAASLAREHRADLVHVRSYVAGAMALPVIETAGVPLLFDTRGLWADEKVDAGEWLAEGPMYRAAKDVERELFMRADAVTVLTERVRRWLREEYAHRRTLHAPIHVIPTCTDLDHFRPDCAPDRSLAARIAADERVLVYVGSIGGRYLPEEMARFYLAWRAAVRARGLRARLLVVSRQRPTRFHAVLGAHGCEGELIAVSADRDQMPALVRCAHAGVLFYRDVPSAIACMPTKLGELLATGLPFLSNAIADVPRIVEGGDVGLTVDRFDDAALRAAAEALLDLALAPETAVRARARAQRWFALEDAVDAYDALYRSMPASHGRVQPRADASWPRSA